MSRFDSTAEELLDLARGLLANTDPATAGLWPRAAAHLARQALELALDDFWVKTAPGIEEASARAQLICLPEYLGVEELAERVNHAWWVLSRAGHHHPYELAPTAHELQRWLDEVGRILSALEGGPLPASGAETARPAGLDLLAPATLQKKRVRPHRRLTNGEV